MEELKYLSEDYIDLSGEIGAREGINIFHIIKKEKWEDCPISFIETADDCDYFRLHLRHGKVITSKKCKNCQIRRINSGIFENSYCLIQYATKEDKDITKLSVIHKDGVLKYPKFAAYLSVPELDEMFSCTSVTNTIVALMEKFDATEDSKVFESFCEGLPKSCWHRKDFALNIIHSYNIREGQHDKNVATPSTSLGAYAEEVKDRILNYSRKNNMEHFEFIK